MKCAEDIPSAFHTFPWWKRMWHALTLSESYMASYTEKMNNEQP